MQAVKQIGIITGPIEFRRVASAWEATGIMGYAVLRNVLGKGDQKVSSWDSISSEVENSMIITTISADRLMPLVGPIRPVLREFGGACLVSDAMWVIH